MHDDQFNRLAARLELLRVMLEEHEKTSQFRGVLLLAIVVIAGVAIPLIVTFCR